jgi:tetratricopeptide (TPR) repeat protein
VTKIYLTELLLKALRNYHMDSSVHSKILNLLKDIETLFEKELYDLCYYKIEKAEGLARQYEKFSLLTEVLFWKRRLALAVSAKTEDVNSLVVEEETAIAQMKMLNTWWGNTINMNKLIKDDNFLKESGVPANNKSNTLQSQVLHYHILHGIHFVKGDRKKADKNISDLIRLLERFPHRIQEDPHSYVTAIGNKIGLYLIEKKWKAIPSLIKKMRQVPTKYKLKSESRFTVRLWLRLFNVELEMYRDSRQLEKGVVLITEVERFIDSRRKSIPSDYLLLLYYQFANIFFLKKNYTQSLRWLNEIINVNFGDTRKDIQCYARILNLMVHFELKNIIVLRYALDSCRRFLKKKRVEITSEKKLLTLFSKLCHAHPDEYPTIVKKAYGDIFPAGSGQTQDYIDIKGWIEEKVFRYQR